jgi:hypothetical protein
MTYDPLAAIYYLLDSHPWETLFVLATLLFLTAGTALYLSRDDLQRG